MTSITTIHKDNLCQYDIRLTDFPESLGEQFSNYNYRKPTRGSNYLMAVVFQVINKSHVTLNLYSDNETNNKLCMVFRTDNEGISAFKPSNCCCLKTVMQNLLELEPKIQIVTSKNPEELLYLNGYGYDGGFLVDTLKERGSQGDYHPNKYYLVPIVWKRSPLF